MSVVIIAEKPSVAADLANVLGVRNKTETHWASDDIIITWAIGHMLELKFMDEYDVAFKNWSKSIELLPYVPEKFLYNPIQDRKKQLNAILKLLKDKSVTEIVNACDAAREGELIFREIIEHAQVNAPTSRMWMQSMTYDALLEAYETRKSGDQYQSLSDAAFSRSYADWIIGMNASRAASLLYLNRKGGEKTSLGRVQTATLALVVDHEIEVLSHIPIAFWQLNATFSAGAASWTARWERTNHTENPDKPELKATRIVDASEKSKLETLMQSQPKFETTEHTRTKTEQPPLNFDLTALQKRANSQWSWSSKRTLRIAQDLYETYKLTTYPRTDSKYLPEDMHETVAKTLDKLKSQSHYTSLIANLQKSGLANVNRNFDDSKVSDHFAIIPTGQAPQAKLNTDHQKLYDLIVKNFLASWFPSAEWDVVRRISVAQGEQFIKEVEQLRTPGWRTVITKKNNVPDGWGTLPSNPCDTSVQDFEFTEELSKPKNRLNEAGLLQLMEHAGKNIEDDDLAQAMKDKGLGTPATRADTIEKLISREYIRRSKNSNISATAHGIRTVDVLRRIPVEWITSAELTGEMEASLLSVQRGQLDSLSYMQKVIEQTQDMVVRIRELDRSVLYQNDEPIGICPACNNAVRETMLSYQCEKNEGKGKGCSFVLWKDTMGRWFDKVTAARLLHQREIANLHGFFSKNGDGYESSIQLADDGKVNIAGAASTASSDEEILCACPVCEQGSIRISTRGYACDVEECNFKGMLNVMCQRTITPEEARKIFTDGKSELLENFTSKRNKPFSAYLILDKNRIAFEFPPREAASSAKRFQVMPGVVAVCPTHKTHIVESETHYLVENNDKGCKIQIERSMSKRDISREEAKDIIENKGVGPFDDFTSNKTGKPFSAELYMKKNESVGYKFPKRS